MSRGGGQGGAVTCLGSDDNGGRPAVRALPQCLGIGQRRADRAGETQVGIGDAHGGDQREARPVGHIRGAARKARLDIDGAGCAERGILHLRLDGGGVADINHRRLGRGEQGQRAGIGPVGVGVGARGDYIDASRRHRAADDHGGVAGGDDIDHDARAGCQATGLHTPGECRQIELIEGADSDGSARRNGGVAGERRQAGRRAARGHPRGKREVAQLVRHHRARRSDTGLCLVLPENGGDIGATIRLGGDDAGGIGPGVGAGEIQLAAGLAGRIKPIADGIDRDRRREGQRRQRTAGNRGTDRLVAERRDEHIAAGANRAGTDRGGDIGAHDADVEAAPQRAEQAGRNSPVHRGKANAVPGGNHHILTGENAAGIDAHIVADPRLRGGVDHLKRQGAGTRRAQCRDGAGDADIENAFKRAGLDQQAATLALAGKIGRGRRVEHIAGRIGIGGDDGVIVDQRQRALGNGDHAKAAAHRGRTRIDRDSTGHIGDTGHILGADNDVIASADRCPGGNLRRGAIIDDDHRDGVGEARDQRELDRCRHGGDIDVGFRCQDHIIAGADPRTGINQRGGLRRDDRRDKATATGGQSASDRAADAEHVNIVGRSEADGLGRIGGDILRLIDPGIGADTGQRGRCHHRHVAGQGDGCNADGAGNRQRALGFAVAGGDNDALVRGGAIHRATLVPQQRATDLHDIGGSQRLVRPGIGPRDSSGKVGTPHRVAAAVIAER